VAFWIGFRRVGQALGYFGASRELGGGFWPKDDELELELSSNVNKGPASVGDVPISTLAGCFDMSTSGAETKSGVFYSTSERMLRRMKGIRKFCMRCE